MAQNVIEILIKAKNQASAELAKVDKALAGVAKALKGTFGGFTELSSAINLTERVFRSLKGVYDEIIGSTVEYGKQVDDMARALGTSTEEASKLIQVADDLRIEVGSLQTAFRIALKQGILPSIDGLKQMAEEYQNLRTPQERAQFALKTFGRSGLQMQKILELDAKAIDEMAKSAEEAGLVMSRDAVNATKDYYLAVDQLNDQMEGLKITVGTKAIPALTDLVEIIDILLTRDTEGWFQKGAREAQSFLANVFGPGFMGLGKGLKQYELLDERLDFLSSGFRYASQEIQEFGDAELEAAQKADELRERINQAASDAILALREMKQQRIEDFFDVDIDPEEIAKQMFDIVAFKEAGGEAMNSLVESVRAAVAEGKITSEQAKEFFKNIAIEGAALKVQLGQISAEDAAESISKDFNVSLEDAKKLVDDVLAGIDLVSGQDLTAITTQFDALQERKALLVEAGEIPLEADEDNTAEDKLDTLTVKLEKLTKEEHKIKIDVEVTGLDDLPDIPIPTPPTGGRRGKRKRQHGGPVSAGSAYIVGEAGPELFIPPFRGEIIPNGARVGVSSGGATYNSNIGGDTINVYNSNATAAVMTNAMISDRRRARLNASMGR